MIASNVSVIREEVVKLLRNSGYNVIEATDLWDRVYSREYFLAKPGRTTIWLIGEYQFTFTKQGEPETTKIKPTYEKVSRKPSAWLIAFAIFSIICIALVVIAANGGF